MTLSLSFGMELELLLQPNHFLKDALLAHGFDENITFNSKDSAAKQANRNALYKALVAALIAAGISAGLVAGDYTEWTVKDESTLDEVPGFWRCEIVSAVMNTEENWQEQIDIVFGAVLQNCVVKLTNGCSMHVHVSPGYTDQRYTLDQMQRVMKGISYYDTALTRILPAERKENLWCQPMTTVYKDIEAGVNDVPLQSWAPLFDSFHKGGFLQLLVGKYTKRDVGWNFGHVMNTCGTVECRRPPGTKTAAEAKNWVAIVLGYFANAIAVEDWDAIKNTTTRPSTEDLRRAITRGIGILGPYCVGALGTMQDINEPALVITAEEAARINQKKKDKQLHVSPFATKINSRRNSFSSARS